jgi:hypothetical protein
VSCGNVDVTIQLYDSVMCGVVWSFCDGNLIFSVELLEA